MGAVSRCCEEWCVAWLKATLVWEGLSRMVEFYFILLVLSVALPVHSEPIDEVFAAIRGGKEKDVKRILEENADSLASFINKQDPSSGQTPVMMAVLMGKEEVVKLLLKEPAVDASIPEKDGYTPFHGAGFQGSSQHRQDVDQRLQRLGP